MCDCHDGEHECCCLEDPTLFFHLEKGAIFKSPRDGDAGFDLYSLEDVVLEVNQQYAVSTGLKVAIPEGWVGIVKDRSSMAKQRIYTHAGVIDAAYRGEVKILLSNNGTEPYKISKGDKVAQMIVIPCLTGCEQVENEEELGETERGEAGFGSTGK